MLKSLLSLFTYYISVKNISRDTPSTKHISTGTTEQQFLFFSTDVTKHSTGHKLCSKIFPNYKYQSYFSSPDYSSSFGLFLFLRLYPLGLLALISGFLEGVLGLPLLL